ncbi:MAG: hypothetical protein AB2A00_08575 [Myxococcota bacterium]
MRSLAIWLLCVIEECLTSGLPLPSRERLAHLYGCTVDEITHVQDMLLSSGVVKRVEDFWYLLRRPDELTIV